MTEARAINAVPINLYELAVIITESIINVSRPDGMDPCEAFIQIAGNPCSMEFASRALTASQRIGEYLQASCDSTIALQKLGAL